MRQINVFVLSTGKTQAIDTAHGEKILYIKRKLVPNLERLLTFMTFRQKHNGEKDPQPKFNKAKNSTFSVHRKTEAI